MHNIKLKIKRHDSKINQKVYFIKIHVLFVFNTYRKIRLQKWNIPYGHNEKNKLCKEIIGIILEKPNNSCTCLKYRDFNIVYSKYKNFKLK